MKSVAVIIITTLCLVASSCDPGFSKDQRLRNALKSGDTNYLGQYLASGGNVNQAIQVDSYVLASAPLLDVSIEDGQTGALNFLLRKGANPNQFDSRGETPLLWAIGRSRAGIPHEIRVQNVKLLLLAKADPNLKEMSGFGWTPLCMAADFGEKEMANLLLTYGAKINLANNEGLTALNYAADADVARLLIAAGADRTARTDGETPAETALRLGHYGALAVLTNASANTKAAGQKADN